MHFDPYGLYMGIKLNVWFINAFQELLLNFMIPLDPVLYTLRIDL